MSTDEVHIVIDSYASPTAVPSTTATGPTGSAPISTTPVGSAGPPPPAKPLTCSTHR